MAKVAKKKITKKKVMKKKVAKKKEEVTIKNLSQSKLEDMVTKLNAIAHVCVNKMEEIAQECGIKINVEVFIKDIDTVT